mgnify:CR=1 FL=1
MGISPYAAIVIGSKNMLMKVYEISGGKGFRTVDESMNLAKRPILQERLHLRKLKKSVMY